MKKNGYRAGGIGCLLGLLLLLVGCSDRPRIRPLTGASVVVAFGDSITAGTGADRGESYPAVLAELLGCRVVNAGVPGEVTAEGLVRLPGVLEQERPGLVVLCHGGNDMLRREKDEVVGANLAAMVSAIRESGADVILIGVPRPGLLLKVPGFYRDVARKSGIPFESEILPDVYASPALKSDPTHPNAEGYRRMAAAVADRVRKSQ